MCCRLIPEWQCKVRLGAHRRLDKGIIQGKMVIYLRPQAVIQGCFSSTAANNAGLRHQWTTDRVSRSDLDLEKILHWNIYMWLGRYWASSCKYQPRGSEMTNKTELRPILRPRNILIKTASLYSAMQRGSATECSWVLRSSATTTGEAACSLSNSVTGQVSRC
jgi:hypothetical protein